MLRDMSPVLAQMGQTPLLIDAEAAPLFQSCVQHMLGDDRVRAELDRPTDVYAAAADTEFWGEGDEDDWRTYYRPYNVQNGILQIPVMGVLLAKFSMSFGRWATGYKYIEMALKRAREDYANGSLLGVAMVIDSPGGMVTDCFELCAKIRDAAAEMPVRAFAADHAYSAAYAIASSCGRPLSVTSSGGVGSIGVVFMHMSVAGSLDKAGLEVTFISAGEGKTDGNQYEKLSDGAKSRIQARINKIYTLFSSTVAIGRDMEEEDVIACKAYTYDAEDGIAKGLADKIGALDEELAAYALEINDQGDFYMTQFQPQTTGRKTGGDSAAAHTDGVTLETHRHEVQAAEQRGMSQGQSEGAKAERARIDAIMSSDEAQTRPIAAKQVAMKSDMATNDAIAFLKGMPEEKATAPVVDPAAAAAAAAAAPAPKPVARNHFAEAMASTPNPDVGAGGEPAGGESGEEMSSDQKTNVLLAAFAADTGAGPKKK